MSAKRTMRLNNKVLHDQILSISFYFTLMVVGVFERNKSEENETVDNVKNLLITNPYLLVLHYSGIIFIFHNVQFPALSLSLVTDVSNRSSSQVV